MLLSIDDSFFQLRIGHDALTTLNRETLIHMKELNLNRKVTRFIYGLMKDLNA